MKKVLFHYSFVLPFLLFLFHQVIQKGMGINILLLDNFLDPFCLSAITLTLVSLERNLFFNQTHLTLLEVVITTLVLIFISELFLPKLTMQFTADVIDVGMILLGSVWYLLLNPSSKRVLNR